nr:MAG TPA: hypothetical protein [Caudoviricetes sp.]
MEHHLVRLARAVPFPRVARGLIPGWIVAPASGSGVDGGASRDDRLAQLLGAGCTDLLRGFSAGLTAPGGRAST